MSKNVAANALGLPRPGFGLFSVPPLSITMTFPDAHRLTRQQPSPSETEAAAHGDGDPSPQSAEASVSAEGLPVQAASAQASTPTSADLDRASVQAALRGDQAA